MGEVTHFTMTDTRPSFFGGVKGNFVLDGVAIAGTGISV